MAGHLCRHGLPPPCLRPKRSERGALPGDKFRIGRCHFGFGLGVRSLFSRVNFSVSNLLAEKSFSLEKLLTVRSSTVENDFATNFLSTGVTSAPANFLSCAELTSVMLGRKSRSASFLSCSCAPTGKGKLVIQRSRKKPALTRDPAASASCLQRKSVAAQVAQYRLRRPTRLLAPSGGAMLPAKIARAPATRP
jgi:hypothetical protein